MQEALYCGLGHAQTTGQICVGNVRAISRQAATQRIEDSPPVAPLAFRAQARQRLLDDGGRPSDIEKTLRSGGIERPFRKAQMRWRLGHPIVPGNEFQVAASLLRPDFFMSVAQEILNRFEEQRSKPPALRIRPSQQIPSQNCDEEILSQILSVRDGVTATTDKSEDGAPIELAKLRERGAGSPFGVRAGREDDAPARRGEPARAATLLGEVRFHTRWWAVVIFFSRAKSDLKTVGRSMAADAMAPSPTDDLQSRALASLGS